MTPQHSILARGGWQKFSLAEQLGNIGSEVNRAARWQGRDEKSFQNATTRAFELFDFTLEDARWHGRRYEIARAREVFGDAITGGHEYKSSLEDLGRYFLQFAYLARNK